MNPATVGSQSAYFHQDFQVRVAETYAQRRECSRLVGAMYAWRGYEMQADLEQPRAGEVTVQAYRGNDVIGTLTLCCDTGLGIPADGLYKAQIDAYRVTGRPCELTRLAVDPAQRSRDVLGALFYHAYAQAVRGGATDAFIEVNPRHVAFYNRLLKFRQIGRQKTCARVNAPAVLLHREVAAVGRQVVECTHRGRPDSHAAQPFFVLDTARRRNAQRQARLAA